jgi:hypothetical protein
MIDKLHTGLPKGHVVPSEVCLLADLLAGHGKELERSVLQVKGELREGMIGAVEHWANVLLASPDATRSQFAKIATAVERLPAPRLASVLLRLLSADLSNWRVAREEFTAALNKGKRIRSDTQTSWTLQYRRAFAAIGSAEVVEAMKAYLPDAGYCGFGFDAACALKDIWDHEQNVSKDRLFKPVPDFSDVKARREERQSQRGGNSSPFADAIIATVEDLIKPEFSDEAHAHALRLATVAFSMPYGNRTNTIDTLLHLSQPLRVKQALMAVLVVAGEIIQADIALDGIKGLREASKTKQWLLGSQNWWEWEGWLELLPFSDRPRATLDALELIEPNRRTPWQLRRLLSALGYAPGTEADEILAVLPQKDPRFFSEHDWLAAIERRGTLSSARLLLGLICEASVGKAGGIDAWTLSRKLAASMFASGDFRADLYRRYELIAPGVGRGILEYAISEVADDDGVLVLVSSYVKQGKPFDGILHSAIRHVALGERPSATWAGANEIFSVPLPELRQRLFAMIKHDTIETGLATACLNALDELRDDYGPAESEPRHPDIDSGRPWPLTVC